MNKVESGTHKRKHFDIRYCLRLSADSCAERTKIARGYRSGNDMEFSGE